MSDFQRKHLRKHVLFPVAVTAISSGVKGLPSKAFSVTANDFGAGGLGFDFPVALGIGDLLSLDFALPGESRRLHLRARVQSALAIKTPEGKKAFKIGVQFLNLSSEEQTYLTNYMTGTFLLY